jgi:hypothetical protein
MDISNFKIPEASFDDIAKILDQNYGEVTLQSLNDQTFILFVGTAIDAAYRIGLRDGLLKNLKDESK